MNNHIQKPVETRLELGPWTDDVRSICEILLDDGTPETAANLGKVFELFSKGIECGMFSPDFHSPLASKFRLIEHNVSLDRIRTSWRFEGIHVSRAAYRVLINLLRRMPSGLPNGLSVQINLRSSEDIQKAEWNALSAFMQPQASHIPFKLIDNLYDPPSKQTVVVIHTLEELGKEAMVGFSGALDAWAEIVMRSGLSNEPSDGSQKGDVASLIEYYQIGPQSVECSIFGLKLPCGVFECLVNVLIFLHETIVKIESVEMD